MPGIEIAWAEDEDVRVEVLEVEDAATLKQALEAAAAAGLLPPDLLEAARAGRLDTAIHGRTRALDHRLAAGDRIEILGPLTVDPKVARQRRVAHRRAAQGRDKWNPSGSGR